MITINEFNYMAGSVNCKGFYAAPAANGKKPAVLIAHDWAGCNEVVQQKAQKIAELGYVGIAIDMFGEGRTGNTVEEKTALIKPLVDNRDLLKERVLAAFDAAKKLERVDPANLVAIGFCFGGLCVIDLARSGATLKGIVSFHGLLFPPAQSFAYNIDTKILILHGNDDPLVPDEQVANFKKEMSLAKADWQMHIYGNTKHAFTNPSAHDDNSGIIYNALADKRSWLAMSNFLAEVFGN